MKQFLVLVGLLALASAAHKGSLRAKFGQKGFGTESFLELPRTVEAAKAAGYTLRTRPAGDHLPSLELYCPTPARLCTLFDDTGYIAGLQVGIDAANFKNLYDLEAMGMRKWKTTEGEYWTVSQFFISEASLAKAKDARIAARNPSTMLQEQSVWVTGTGGQLFEVPRDQKKLDQTKFKIQGCLQGMGVHYYYDMSSKTQCNAKTILPWFPLVDSGELIGMGFINAGTMPPTSGQMDWFDRPSQQVVKVIVPHAPQCLYDLAVTPGALTMHTYYVDEPWTIKC